VTAEKDDKQDHKAGVTEKPAVKKTEKKPEPVKTSEAPKDQGKTKEPVPEKKDEIEIVDEEKEEEGKYKPKAKPELSKEEKAALSFRRAKKKKTPYFRRQEWFRYKKLGDAWRRPRGLHSKLRMNYLYRPAKVSEGYRGPKLVRGRHPSGFEEILVFSPKDLAALNPKKQAARIGHTVGTRKRMQIKEKADELGIRILNWGG
jgi:large subunit ribosomal protein L32e